ncbi:UbiA family prenyltransferase [Natronoarchaeum mannanilyticum]
MQRVRAAGRRFGATAVRTAVLALVHSGVWISLGAASVAVATMLLAGFPLDPVPAFVAFAATTLVYGLDRVLDREADAQNLPGRASFAREHGRALLIAGVALYLVAARIALAWGPPGLAAMTLPPAVVALYSGVGVKRLFLVKNLLVGAAWGLLPLGVGAYFGAIRSTGVVALAGFFAAMLTIAAAIFDVKDIEGDRARGVRTLPAEYGPRTTRRLAACATVGVAASVAAAVAASALPPGFLALLPYCAYVVCYSLVATPERGPLFYGFVVDGEHTALALLLFALELLG